MGASRCLRWGCDGFAPLSFGRVVVALSSHEIMKSTTLNLSISLRILLCAVTLHALTLAGFALPQYVEVGTLPVPTADQRVEVFDDQTQVLYSIPTYANGYQHAVYYCRPGTNNVFTWTQTTPNPDQLDFGRASSSGTHLYFNGTYISGSAFAPINGDGSIRAWQETTPFPISTFPGWSLHQEFVFNGKFYLLGGWHGGGLYAYAYYATIQGNGSLGAFVQTTSLPRAMAGHSAAVSSDGKLYVGYGTNLYFAQIAADGTIGPFTAQPAVSGMNHNIGTGNNGMALLGNLLVIVDGTTTFVCRLNASGQVDSLTTSITNSRDFGARYVYANNGNIYVTSTATGKV